MKILIAGAGKVGSTVARQLSSEGHDLTLIDSKQEVLDHALERFDEVVEKILSSEMMKPGTLVIIEHGKDRDYSSHPLFRERRAYGSVNFSIFETSNSQE